MKQNQEARIDPSIKEGLIIIATSQISEEKTRHSISGVSIPC
jgi:hypothetical protein